MAWLIRGIIISTIALGITAFLLFPEATFNTIISPVLNTVMQETDVNDTRGQGSEATIPQPVQQPPIIKPTPVVTTNIENLNTQNKPQAQTVLLQPPPNSLNDSDVHVISLVNEISPTFKQWITPAEQIRKWVAFVDLMAQGKVFSKYKPLTFKPTAFKTITKDGALYADPESYKRFNAFIEAITYVKPDLLARYYRYWLPILDKAYAELGNEQSFSVRLRLTIDNILAVKPLKAEQAVLTKPTSVTYKYLHSDIEGESNMTKWVWRIGPDNAEKLQSYLSEFNRQLNN